MSFLYFGTTRDGNNRIKRSVSGLRFVLKLYGSQKEVLYSRLSGATLGTGNLSLKSLAVLHRFEVALLCVYLYGGSWGRVKTQKREWLGGKWTELRHLIKRCVGLDQILASMLQLTILYKMSHLPISAGLSLGKFCSLKALDLFVEGDGEYIS